MTWTYLPGMIERKWGRVINIGSTAATVEGVTAFGGEPALAVLNSVLKS